MNLQTVGIIIGILLLGLTATTMYQRGYEAAEAKYELQISQKQTDDANKVVTVVEDNRAEETRRSEVVEKVDAKASDAQQSISVAVAESNVAADRLSVELEKVRAKYASSQATCDVRIAQLSKTGTSTVELLTDLYKGADRRATGFAEVADRARERGLACELIYDETRNKGVDVSIGNK